MPYIDQTFYIDVYKGAPVDEGAFPRLLERACDSIDQLFTTSCSHKTKSINPWSMLLKVLHNRVFRNSERIDHKTLFRSDGRFHAA